MMGDNLYGGESAKDYKAKFEDIYKPLLDAKVKFYASLGNHDESNQRFYDHFNMNGNEYYSFKKGKVAFYALNSNYMDPKQVKWIEDELSKDDSEWKICFFHHPPYSSGKKPRVGRAVAASGRAHFRKARRRRCLYGARALLRAHKAATGDPLFHLRRGRQAAARRREGVEADREVIR